MGAGHDHGGGEIKYEKPLWIAFALTAGFLVVEVVGAVLSNSLALLSDAAHMATDVIALAISLFAVRLSRRPADAKRTYGYARMEAIGALINGALLFTVAGYVLWEAFGRFLSPPPVASNAMLWVASTGLIVNLISMRLLKAGAGENLNRGSAGIHVKNSHSMPKQLIINMFGRMKRSLVAKRFSDPDGFKLASMTALVLSAAAALYKVAAWGAMPWVSRQMKSFR